MLTVGDETVRVTIPAGIADGQRLKLRGHGGAAPQGGTRGDLYVTFRITPDNTFTRVGNDLHLTLPITLTTAVLGGEITIPTLNNDVRIKVNAGSQPNSKLRLRGKGFPIYKHEGSYGDLIINLTITLPTTLSKQQRALFTELQATGL